MYETQLGEGGGTICTPSPAPYNVHWDLDFFPYRQAKMAEAQAVYQNQKSESSKTCFVS